MTPLIPFKYNFICCKLQISCILHTRDGLHSNKMDITQLNGYYANWPRSIILLHSQRKSYMCTITSDAFSVNPTKGWNTHCEALDPLQYNYLYVLCSVTDWFFVLHYPVGVCILSLCCPVVITRLAVTTLFLNSYTHNSFLNVA